MSGRNCIWNSAWIAPLTLCLSAIAAHSALAQGHAGAVSFDLPAQPLSVSLAALARQTGLQLAYPASLTAGRKAPALRGSFSPEDALDRLLAGTGLSYEFSGGSTVAITRTASAASSEAGADGSILLDTVTVDGEHADGPVGGYVATRSATGTKTDTQLIRTPQSISVISREQVEAQGAQTLVQALRYSAGVAAEIRGTASRYDIPYIRGFGSATDRVQFLDGMRLLRGAGYAFPQVETYGIERIEFLKGPSSTLYGTSMAGGLINSVSKKPLAEPYHEVEALFGNHGRAQAAFDFSGPVMDDGTLLYRLVGLGRRSETQVDQTKEERRYIAPSFTWAPDADTTLTVNASYQRDPHGGYYGVLPTVGTLWPSPDGQIPRSFYEGDPAYAQFDREQAMIGYQFEHAFDETWTVRHNLRYLDLTSVTEDVTTQALAANGRTLSRYALGTDEAIHGLTSDLQVEAKFDTGPLEHTTLVGFDYQHSAWTQTRDYGPAPAIDILAPRYGIARGLRLSEITNQRQVFDQSGFYAQDQIGLGGWSLVLGGRYDSVDLRTTNRLNRTEQSQEDGAVSGKVGLIYNFDNGVAPYISYSTSFLPVSGTDAKGQAFTPTTAEPLEVGVKYQPEAFDGLFTLAYFDITQHDVVTALNPVTRYQSGEQRSRGLEFEERAALTDRINLTGAFTYTDARIVDGLGADVGDPPVAIPTYTASLWGDYRFSDGPLDGLTVGSGIRYVGESVGGYSPNVFTKTARRLDVPDYTLVDLALTYDVGRTVPRFEGVTAKVNVTNLLNRTYVTCLADNFCNYGNGRSVFGSVAYRW